MVTKTDDSSNIPKDNNDTALIEVQNNTENKLDQSILVPNPGILNATELTNPDKTTEEIPLDSDPDVFHLLCEENTDSQGDTRIYHANMCTDLGTTCERDAHNRPYSNYEEYEKFYMDTIHKVRETGLPNILGARIPLPTTINLELLDSLLRNSDDRYIVEFIKYGWPISRDPQAPDPVPTYSNHPGATKYPKVMEEYIEKEKKMGAILGPFKKQPFDCNFGISPLTTRPKRTKGRRVISDLSWPHGMSVNSGIPPDQYMGIPVKLRYPTVDTLVYLIKKLRDKYPTVPSVCLSVTTQKLQDNNSYLRNRFS